MTDALIINSEIALAQAQRKLAEMWRENKYVEVEFRRKARQRTDQQRKAIEVYCRNLADALNDAGLDQRAVMANMRDGVSLPWSQERVKDVLWREIQIAMLGKKSTTGLTTTELSAVYEPLNRWTAQTLGVSVPFPSRGEAA